MQLKFTLDKREKIRAFTTIIQMMAKHGKEATLVFDDGKICKLLTINNKRSILFSFLEFLLILLDCRVPYLWIKIDMNSFTISYIFIGAEENCSTQNKIVVSVNLKVLLSALMVFFRGSEVALFRSVNKIFNYSNGSLNINFVSSILQDPFLCIRIVTEIKTGNNTESKALYTTEIPVVLVPTNEWETYVVPSDLVFDAVFRAPRYAILRRYIEIYKKFKFLDCLLRKNTLQLVSDDEYGNKVSSTFDNIKYYSKAANRRNRRTFAKVEAKKISAYMTSLNSLSCIKVTDLKFSIAHRKLLKISFRNDYGDIKFNCILPSKTESGCETDESDDDQEMTYT